MAKMIVPNELAEIVTGLLLEPARIGELDSPERYFAFMQDIAEVVAAHCGGTINQVTGPAGVIEMSTQEMSPMVSVYPNDSLPTLHSNVWSTYDTDGWEDESASELGIEEGEAPTAAAIEERRYLCQTAMTRSPLAQGA